MVDAESDTHKGLVISRTEQSQLGVCIGILFCLTSILCSRELQLFCNINTSSLITLICNESKDFDQPHDKLASSRVTIA